jgi:secreted trypsin-like serine protease
MLLMLSALAFAQEAPPIVNGEETSDFPQVGSLASFANNGYGYDFCSGTLVHEKWVITAAHCVEAFDDNERYGYDNHYFLMGTDIYDASGVTDYAEIVAWHAHPDYSTRNLNYDIGILELGRSISSTDPMPVNDDTPSVNWGDITYVGWGITGDDDYYSSGTKRTVDVPIYYVSYNHVYTYDSTEGKNICSGDSGGAMLSQDDGVWELVGANSFGFSITGGQPNCEGSDAAAAATRVDTSLDWLEDYVELYRAEDFEPSDDGGSDGGSGDGGSSDGGDDGGDGGDTTGDGDGGSGPSGGGDGSGDGGGADTGASEGPDAPARPDGDLAVTCSSAGGGGAAGLLGALIALVGAARRREETA